MAANFKAICNLHHLNKLSFPLIIKALHAQQLWSMFESINLSDLGLRSNNDLDLWYSYVFMYSLSQLFVQNLNSSTSILLVSIKPSII